jgi:hypothetical protein
MLASFLMVTMRVFDRIYRDGMCHVYPRLRVFVWNFPEPLALVTHENEIYLVVPVPGDTDGPCP